MIYIYPPQIIDAEVSIPSTWQHGSQIMYFILISYSLFVAIDTSITAIPSPVGGTLLSLLVSTNDRA